MRETLNGKLIDFNPKTLMENVKANHQSLYVEVSNDDIVYYISIHFEGIFGTIDRNTKYWVDIVSEDSEGNQERVTTYKDWSNLSELETTQKLNEWKWSVLILGEE